MCQNTIHNAMQEALQLLKIQFKPGFMLGCLIYLPSNWGKAILLKADGAE